MSGEGGELGHLVDSCLDVKWHLNPVEATGAGVTQHDHLLGSYGVDDVLQTLAAVKSLTGALEEIATESLDDEIDRSALLNDLRITLHRFEREQPHVHNPGFWLEHALDGLYLLSVARDRKLEHRAQAVEGRLAALPEFLDVAKETLKDCPAVFVETGIRLVESGAGLVNDIADTFASSASTDFPKAYAEACEALKDFASHLRFDLADSPKDGFAIGEDAFNYRLHYEHALSASAAELWRYGNRLVESTEAELNRISEEIDPGQPWRDVVDRLRSLHPSADDLVSRYRTEMERSHEFVMERGIARVPNGGLEVIETPEFLRTLIPFAAYQPPGAFSSDRTGWFYVTPPSAADAVAAESMLRDHCDHEISCTALHEGYPGHHLQFLSAQAQPRTVRKVVSTPVTVEGWALYCEEMMGEEGFYRNAEERLFQRVALLWRAVRVVLDVGLHTRGMTMEDATDLLMDKVQFDRAHAEAEVRRYCAHPGYQLCYAIGRRELTSLRESYRQSQGTDYSLSNFHREVLRFGGLPVSLIRWGMGLSE